MLKVKGKIRVEPGTWLTVAHMAEIAGQPDLVESVGGLTLCKVASRRRVMVVSALEIAGMIMVSKPDIKVTLHGDDEVVVLVEALGQRGGWVSMLKTAVVVLVLFFGSGLAIMNFHSEVSMREAHYRIYRMITGQEVTRPLIMQIPYSLGIGLGIALFFNHFRGLMGRDEPSPLEVEMFLYDRNVQQCIASDREERTRGEGN